MRILLVQLLVAEALLFGGPFLDAAPTVLFSDNFTGTGTADAMNLNYGLARRQTGALGLMSYIPNGNAQVGNTGEPHNKGNVLLLSFGANAGLLYNFNQAKSVGGLQISFDFDANSHTDYGDTTTWAAINFGAGLADRVIGVGGAGNHFGILFRADGRIQAFDGPSVVSPEPTYWAGAGAGNYSGQMHHIDIMVSDLVDGNPFDGFGDTQIDIYVDGSTTPAYSYTKSGGFTDNFINFQGDHIADIDNVTITQLDPPTPPAEPWSVAEWLDDASAGADATYLYTHAYNFGGSAAVINNVIFTGIWAANPDVPGRFSFSGIPSGFQNDTGNVLSGGGSRKLANDFLYGGNRGSLTLNGLTPGKHYVLTFYSSRWDGIGQRLITFASGSDQRTIDQDAFGTASRNGIIVSYAYTATSDTMIFTATPLIGGNTFHCYGFANREVTPATSPNPWSYAQWTSDSTTGVNPAYNYTHAYTFGGSAAATTINTIPFAAARGGNPSVSGKFSVTGVGNAFGADGGAAVTGDSAVMASSFIYGGSPGTLTLQGLTPGTQYVLSLFSTAWEGAGTRFIGFSSVTGQKVIDQDIYDIAGSRNGIVVSYAYRADAAGTVVVQTSPVAAGSTFHWYGFCNREGVPRSMPPQIIRQPASKVSKPEQTATLTVEVDGSQPLHYQWYFKGFYRWAYDWLEIPAAVDANYTCTTSTETVGFYQVVVSNCFGSVTSAPTSIALVTSPPFISHHQPSGDISDASGALGMVDVWFSKAINPATFTASDVALTNPHGESVQVSNICTVGLNRYRIHFKPQISSGKYHMLIGPCITDEMGNSLDQNGDGIQGDPTQDIYDAGFNLVPLDLVLSGLDTKTNELYAGQPLTIGWIGQNRLLAALQGEWSDAVYLSKDAQWDISDVLLATIHHTGGLASNQVYAVSANVTIPGLPPGTYYFVLRSDIFQQEEAPGTRRSGQVVVGPVQLTYLALVANGPAAKGILTATNRAHYYSVQLASGENLRLRLHASSLSGGNELFVRFGAIPSQQQFDSRSVESGQDLELALTAPPSGGTAYVLLSGPQVGPGNSYELQAETGPVFVSSINPKLLLKQTPGIVALSGAGFDSSTTVEFIRRDGGASVPTGIEVISPQLMRLSLDLTNWAAGPYDIRVTKGSGHDVLPKSFTVVVVGIDRVETKLTLPEAVWNHDRKSIVWIEYRNVGQTWIPAPLLVLRCDPAGYLTADPNILPTKIWSNHPLPWITNVVQVLGVGGSSIPWILQPGEVGRIPIFFLGDAIPYTWEPFNFSVTTMAADTTNRIDWASQEALIRPTGMDDQAWGEVFAKLQERIGPIWGGYVSALAEALPFLPIEAQVSPDSKTLFSILLQQATGLGNSRLLGQVVKADDNQKLAGVAVVARQECGPNQTIVNTVTTDAEGSFAFTNLPPGNYEMFVEGYYAPETQSFLVPNMTTVTGALLRVLAIPSGPAFEETPLPDSDPIVATDALGNAQLVWRRGPEIWHAWHDGTNWHVTGSLPGAGGFEPSMVTSQSLIDEKSGGTFVTWRSDSTNSSSISYAIGRPISTSNAFQWTEPRVLQGTETLDNAHASVALQRDGKVLVVWLKKDPSIHDDTDLYYAQLPISGGSLRWSSRTLAAEESTAQEASLGIQGVYGEHHPMDDVSPVEMTIDFLPFDPPMLTVPESVPILGGGYHTKLGGTLKGKVTCRPELTLGAMAEIEWPILKFKADAKGKWGWKSACNDSQCVFLFDYGSLISEFDVQRDILTKLRLYGLEVVGSVRVKGSTELKWKGAAGWPSEGKVAIGIAGDLKAKISGTITNWGKVEGKAGIGIALSAEFQSPEWKWHGKGEVIVTILEAKVGPLKAKWERKFPFGEQSSSRPKAPDDEPAFVLDTTLGTTSVYEGNPVIANVGEDVREDGAPTLTTTVEGETLLAWIHEAEVPEMNLGSKVRIASLAASKWTESVEIPVSEGFNSEVKLASDDLGQPIAVWSMASSSTVNIQSPVDQIMEAMNRNKVVYSILSNGAWSSPKPIVGMSGGNHSISLVSGVNQNVLAAWIQGYDTNQTLWAAFWDGKAWQSARAIAIGQFEGIPSSGFVAGQATIFWTQEVGSGTNPSESRLFSSSFDRKRDAWRAPTLFGESSKETRAARSPKAPAFLRMSAPAACCVCSSSNPPPNLPDPPPNPSSPSSPPNQSGPSGPSVPPVRSWDPNDKSGPAGYGESRFLPVGTMLFYEIRFENMTNATAPAQQVVVSDTLDPHLDLGTFEIFELAFGRNVIYPPPGLDAYEELVPLNANGANILVHVQAALDYTTRTFKVNLTALDPQTGWLPDDPLVGLLYPNDDTARGEGHISYLVQAQKSVTTGTTITNQARIVFDYNDPIDTPTVSNTIDSVAPTSRVLPLPSTTNHNAILVQWAGNEDAGGVGIGAFDIYISDNAGPWALWLRGVTNTEELFIGECGHSYGFFSMARDNVDNWETAADAAQSQIYLLPNTPPVLDEPGTRFIAVGQRLIITNRATEFDVGQHLTFSLAPGAPGGMTVDPTNGVLRWRPACIQSGSSNWITVLATDDGCGALSGAQSFAVVVSECLQTSLGVAVSPAGGSGCIGVGLESGLDLTNLSLTIAFPPARFTSFNVTATAPEVGASKVLQISSTQAVLTLAARPGQALRGPKEFAKVCFTLLPDQSSAFVRLEIGEILGLKTNGLPIGNSSGAAGRTVVVSEQPLLEGVYGPGNKPSLVLYAKPGWNCTIQQSASLAPGNQWQEGVRLTVTNLVTTIAVPGTNVQAYYRAVRSFQAWPSLSLQSIEGPVYRFKLAGEVNATYSVQTTTNLCPVISWQPVMDLTLSNGWSMFGWTNRTDRQRFFRAVGK